MEEVVSHSQTFTREILSADLAICMRLSLASEGCGLQDYTWNYRRAESHCLNSATV